MYPGNRPRIGIVADVGRAVVGPWDEVVSMAPHPESDRATEIRDRVELAIGRAALEDPEHPFCIGVQWHPEVTASEDGGRLFRALVAQCSQADRCR